MMILPRFNNDASESLIMYLTDPAHLKEYESQLPGCTERLLTEAQKQLSHNRKRFWALIIVALLIGLSATRQVPAEILHTLMALF
jgi:uncharacterized membrane protein